MADQFSKMYDVERVGGDQRQRLAEMLRANALNAPQGQMVSGWYVPPSWTQNLAHLAQTATGVFGGIAAEDAEREAEQRDFEKLRAAKMGQAVRDYGQPQQTPFDQAVQSQYPSTPAAGTMQDGQFRAMKTGGAQGMPNFGVTPQQQPQQPQIDLTDPRQFESRMGRQFARQNMMQQFAPPEWSTDVKYDQQGRGYVTSKTGQIKMVTDAQGNPVLQPLDLNAAVVPEGVQIRGQINPLALGAKQLVARAGAPNQTVINAGPKELNTQLGKGIGEGLIAAQSQAQKAFANNTQLDTLEKALPNAIVGTGAGARLDLARLGETLGVGGKDNSERLRNTAVLLQGFAQNELTAAEAMKGQGQITEGERVIIRRMAAGDPNMTPAEIQMGLGVLRKSNNFKIARHEQNLQTMKADPNMREMYQYMAQPLTAFPTETPQQQQPAAPGAQRGGARFRGYVGQPQR